MKLSKDAIQKKLDSRQSSIARMTNFRLEDYLFKEQLDFVMDPASYKTAVCSRRAGKTVSCAAHMIYTAINNPGTVCLYITTSNKNAKKIIWDQLLNINTSYKLNAKSNIVEQSLTFPNRSKVYISGAKDKSEVENFRGVPLKLVYIDECQSFRAYIKELIDEVLEPALMDWNGTLCLTGTPGPLPSGYFYECAVNSKAWSKHKWTFFDNPFLTKTSKQTHDQMLNRVLSRRGVGTDNPGIQREFFGKWVLDSNSLLVQYDKTLNHYENLPKHKMTYVMGIDIGHNDADALAVLGWTDHSNEIFLVEEKLAKKQDITDLMNNIELMRKKYDISKLVIDTGGLGKKIAEEFIRRYQIPLQAADKVRKMENVALLNDYLRTSKFKAKDNSKFAQDSFLVEIDRDKTTPDRIVVSDSYHSDIIDAVLYAFKESPAYVYQASKPKPKYGTREWGKQQEQEMFEAEVEGLTKDWEQIHDNDY